MEHQLANGQFLLTVSGTEHGEWQGSLHTADGRDVSFRSVMFPMGVHTENFQGKDSLRQRRQLREPRFLAHLAGGNGPKIALAVGMSAEPGPGLVKVVVRHERPRPAAVDDPGRGGEVRHFIFPR